MALGWTQPLQEMSTTNLPVSKGRLGREADNFTAICGPIVYRDVSQPYATSQPVTGIASPYLYLGLYFVWYHVVFISATVIITLRIQ
jgi:hypothetical protein